MNLHCRMKNWVLENDVDYTQLIYVLIIPIIILLHMLFVGFPVAASFFMKDAVAPLSLYLHPVVGVGIFSVFFLVYMAVLFIQGCFLREYRYKDKKNDTFVKKTVILECSESISKKPLCFFPNLLGLFYWKENMTFQKCKFRSLSDQDDGVFYYLFSRNKHNSFNSLYDLKESFFDVGVIVKSIVFTGDLPLQIIYGKHSLYLKSFCPAEGYVYTEDQIKAINELNVHFSFKEKKKADSKMKERIGKQDGYFLPIVLMTSVVAFFTAFFLFVVWGYIDLFLYQKVYFGQIVLVLFGFYLMWICMPRGGVVSQGKYKWKGSSFLTEELIFKNGASINPETHCYSFVFQEEMASDLIFSLKHLNGTNQELTLTVTKNKLHYLKKICDFEIGYWGCFPITDLYINFKEEVPLLITYNRRYRLLQISPSKNHSYSSEQLEAIRNFNKELPSFGIKDIDYILYEEEKKKEILEKKNRPVIKNEPKKELTAEDIDRILTEYRKSKDTEKKL